MNDFFTNDVIDEEVIDEREKLTSSFKGDYKQLCDVTIQMMVKRPKKFGKALKVLDQMLKDMVRMQKAKSYNYQLHAFFLGLYKGITEYTNLGEAKRDQELEDKFQQLGMLIIKMEKNNKSTGRLKLYAKMFKEAVEKMGIDIKDIPSTLAKKPKFTKSELEYIRGLYAKKADIENAIKVSDKADAKDNVMGGAQSDNGSDATSSSNGSDSSDAKAQEPVSDTQLAKEEDSIKSEDTKNAFQQLTDRAVNYCQSEPDKEKMREMMQRILQTTPEDQLMAKIKDANAWLDKQGAPEVSNDDVQDAEVVQDGDANVKHFGSKDDFIKSFKPFNS